MLSDGLCEREQRTLTLWRAYAHSGVYKKVNRFQARMFLNGKSVNIGSFTDEVEAAKAYDRYVPLPASLGAWA